MPYYLKYWIKNVEPLRVSDDSKSEQGQTECLKYIPGATMRGFVVSKIDGEGALDQYKKLLFSDGTAFMNAYFSANEKCLIPSPKGFYEDKRIVDGEKEIENVVVNGEFDEGYKRAGLGTVAELDFDSGLITSYGVKTNCELKIVIGEDKNMFRNVYMKPGQMFCGAIKCESKELLEKIKEIMEAEPIILGNARSSGYGKCEVVNCRIEDTDIYKDYIANEDFERSAYLYLISDTVMRDESGEYCGLNIWALQEKLGVTDLAIQYCATSVRDVRSYNRTLGIRLPAVTMYEKGSIFKLQFQGRITSQKAREVIHSGVGERKNEGYGRILLFGSKYEKLHKKLAGTGEAFEPTESNPATPEDYEVLKQIAKNYYRRLLATASKKYVVDKKWDDGNLSKSKSNLILPILVSNRYDFQKAKQILWDYYGHEEKKETEHKVHNEKASIHTSKNNVMEIIDGDLNELLGIRTAKSKEVMGLPISDLMTEEEVGRAKLELIISKLRYGNK